MKVSLGHVRTLYQDGGSLYLGESNQSYLRVLGEVVQPRTLYDRYGRGGQSVPWLREHVDPRAERVEMAPKLKYVWALDKRLRPALQFASIPYPTTEGSKTEP